MNRRDFLKSALTIAALAPMEKVFSATETGETMNTKTNSTKPQVTRRPYRGTDLTLPLLGFGMMNPDAITLTRHICITMARVKNSQALS